MVVGRFDPEPPETELQRRGLVVLAGCGSSHAVRLSVSIDSGFGAQARHQHFTLRCSPIGGDVPTGIALCRMIAAHPKAMLHPNEPRSGCIGGVGMPQVTVTGSAGRRGVSLAGSPMCDWPGGVSALAYVPVDIEYDCAAAAGSHIDGKKQRLGARTVTTDGL